MRHLPRNTYTLPEVLLTFAICLAVALIGYLFFQGNGDSRELGGIQAAPLPGPTTPAGDYPVPPPSPRPALPGHDPAGRRGRHPRRIQNLRRECPPGCRRLVTTIEKLNEEAQQTPPRARSLAAGTAALRQMAADLADRPKRLWLDKANDISLNVLYVPPGAFKMGRTHKDLEQIARHSDPTQHESTAAAVRRERGRGFLLRRVRSD